METVQGRNQPQTGGREGQAVFKTAVGGAMGVCTKYCDQCVYRKSITGGWWPYCDYLCMTGKPRPCPAGDGCTVRVTRRVYRKRVLTEEEKAQRAGRRRGRNREAKRRSYQQHREQLNAYSREYRKRRKEKGGCEKTDGCYGKVGGSS